MKINWFSPVPPVRSVIAQYTMSVVRELSNKCEIILWLSQDYWEKSLEDICVIKKFEINSIQWSELNSAEFSIFNIGNDFDLFADIYRLSQVYPGIVILHDFSLENFLFRIRELDLSVQNPSIEDEQKSSGFKGWSVAKDYPAKECHYHPRGQKCSELNSVFSNCYGLICHSMNIRNYLSQQNHFPIIVMPFPIDPNNRSGPVAINKKACHTGAPFKLIMFEDTESDQLLYDVIHGICESPVRDMYKLDIYGLSPRSYARNINIYGMKPNITFHDNVSDKEIDHALSMADMAINLQFPISSLAYNAQLKIWANGLPSLVINYGDDVYSSRDVVIHVNKNALGSEIQRQLRNFVRSQKRYQKIGENGRKHILSLISVTDYVKFLVEHFPTMAKRRGDNQVIRLANKMATIMEELVYGHGQKNAESLLDGLQIFLSEKNH